MNDFVYDNVIGGTKKCPIYPPPPQNISGSTPELPFIIKSNYHLNASEICFNESVLDIIVSLYSFLGAYGYPGARGSLGMKGEMGQTGTTGNIGLPGNPGRKGPPGDSVPGPPGGTGVAGYNGTRG
jgi:hypothetical protein